MSEKKLVVCEDNLKDSQKLSAKLLKKGWFSGEFKGVCVVREEKPIYACDCEFCEMWINEKVRVFVEVKND